MHTRRAVKIPKSKWGVEPFFKVELFDGVKVGAARCQLIPEVNAAAGKPVISCVAG